MGTCETDSDHPYYEQLSGKSSKKCYEFFMQDNAKRMKFVSLGEAFDFISSGGGNYVGYNQGDKELTEFAKTWIEKQEPRINWKLIETNKPFYSWEETGREYFYLWNKFHQTHNTPELPRINYETCPLNETHAERIFDRGNRLRCAHQKHSLVKPSFTTCFIEECARTGMKKYEFIENEPKPGYSDYDSLCLSNKDSYAKYLVKKEKYDNETPVNVVDTCYSIIKEPIGFYLPLETVLERLNCSQDSEKDTIHPFTGFTLAEYVKAWFNQSGEKKYWKREDGIESYNQFKDFVPMGTDE